LERFRLEIRVVPRPGLLDPEGKAIRHALHSLDWSGVQDVRVGKVMHMELEAPSSDVAVAEAEAMCRKLLANPVTENFAVSVMTAAPA
jgi:phosphoribosylformylglycinamidine synthase subunit PurS